MAEHISTEIVRRIHTEDGCLEVGEFADAPEALELRSVGKTNIDYWGPINITMDAKFALQLGQALVAAATEKGAKP